MFCAILKVTNNSLQKGMKFCGSIYVQKVMKLLAFIFEQPSYINTVYYEIQYYCIGNIVHDRKLIFNNKKYMINLTIKFVQKMPLGPKMGLPGRSHKLI